MAHEATSLLEDVQAVGRSVVRWLGEVYEQRGELANTDRSTAAPARRGGGDSPSEEGKR